MLRKLFKSDLPALLSIENAAQVTPWPEETFKLCFQAGYSGWVLESEGHVIGFVMLSMLANECHILNLCVARTHQHQGYGRQLMEHVLRELMHLGIHIVYLEVRRSNSRAISLYQSLKFQTVGERKGYYQTVAGNEDALVLARQLSLDNPANS